MVLINLKQVTHGWANYFRHAVAKHTFRKLDDPVWWRVIRLLRQRHHWGWTDVRRRLTTPTGSALLDGQATVKRLRRQDGLVWLMPHNPAYDPIPGEEAHILGKVVAVLRTL